MATPQATTEPHNDARLSLRIVAVLEIISVISSVLITAWVLNPLQLRQPWLEAVPAVLALLLMVNSHRFHRESLRELGFTFSDFGKSIKLLIGPMLVVGIILVSIGYLTQSLQFGKRFWLSLLLLPFWGLVQQYILQGFIYRRFKLICGNGNTPLAIFLAALLFALVHAPNWPLMVLTLMGGVVWTWIYERAPNLLALGLSHGIMSTIAMYSLPGWFLQNMSIGYKYLIYQRF